MSLVSDAQQLISNEGGNQIKNQEPMSKTAYMK